MESTILDTKPSLSEKLKAEIDAVVAEAVNQKAEIQEQIKTLTAQLEQKRENLELADAKVNELDEQRQNLISNGQPTDSIYKEFDAALIARDRLRDEIELIEETALSAKQKELASYQDQIQSAAHTALAKQREVVVAEMQDLFDKLKGIYSEWTDLCTKLQIEYGVQFYKPKMNPFLKIALSDKLRNDLNARTRFRIAKLKK